MKKYFISQIELAHIEEGLPESTSIQCGCGQSYGYLLADLNGVDEYKIIVCDSCYESCDNFFKLNIKDLKKILSRNKKKNDEMMDSGYVCEILLNSDLKDCIIYLDDLIIKKGLLFALNEVESIKDVRKVKYQYFKDKYFKCTLPMS